MMLNWIASHKDLAEALSYWATTGGIIVAFVAGAAAYWKHRQDRQNQEWDRARQSYGKFMEMAFSNPQFYPGYWSMLDPLDRQSVYKYQWFMAFFLWACEDILINGEPYLEWRIAMKVTIIEHRDYFESDSFAAELPGYFKPVRDIIEEALSE